MKGASKCPASHAVYPGSFDPVTCGHLDIIERGARLFDRLTVAVAGQSCSKHFTFDTGTRVAFIERCVTGLENVRVTSFSGLLTDFASSIEAGVVIRGLRAVSDFEYEFQMASMNRNLQPDIETVLIMTRTEFSFLSSSVVKEICSYGGDISNLAPEPIRDDLVKKLSLK